VIYDSYEVKNKILEIPFNKIKKTIYVNSNISHRNIKQCKYLCKFHLITVDEQQFNCGVVSDQRKRNNVLETASNFYNIFKFVYLPYDDC
jgi:hypothetical protein